MATIEDLDAQKVSSIRAMLAQPGGAEAVAHRYGEDAADSDEYRQAEKQLRASRERQSRMRDARSCFSA